MKTIAFQMEKMAEVNPAKNSTLVLMAAASALGHRCLNYTVDELSLKDGAVLARAREVQINLEAETFYTEGEEQIVNLAEVDAVMIRNDPPFNMQYLSACYMLNFLQGKTRVVNNPASVIQHPEKFLPVELKQFMPPTLITSDLKAIADFRAAQGEGGIIVKPLYLFGGTGVHHFLPDNLYLERTVRQMLKDHGAPIVAQRFQPEVKLGDTRVMFLFGELAGAFTRIPKEGSVRANLMQGGSLQKTQITPRMEEIAKALKPILIERDIPICGIDVIGDYLTEINITSPIGFKEVKELYGRDIATEFWHILFA